MFIEINQHINGGEINVSQTGLNGAVIKPSSNSLVGTGFASQYQLQPRAGF